MEQLYIFHFILFLQPEQSHYCGKLDFLFSSNLDLLPFSNVTVNYLPENKLPEDLLKVSTWKKERNAPYLVSMMKV